jgi:hypothetical protein
MKNSLLFGWLCCAQIALAQHTQIVFKDEAQLSGPSGNFIVLKNTDLRLNGTDNVLPFVGTILSTGNSINEISSENNPIQLNHLTVNGATVVIQNNLDITGNLSITSGTLDANGKDIYVADSWTNNGTFIPGSGTVHFTKDIENENQTVTNGSSTLGNFSKTGQSPLVIVGDLSFSGDLEIDNASFGSGTLELVGAGDQQITSNNGTIQIQNLQINKGNSNDHVHFSNPLQVTNLLTLSNGKLDMNGQSLSFQNLSGGASNSYVITGATPLRKTGIGVGTHFMPVGTLTSYTPVTVQFVSGNFSGASLEVQTNSNKVNGLNEDKEYYLNRSWSIEAPGASDFSYNIQLQFANSDIFGEGDEETLFPIKISNGIWYKPVESDFANATVMGSASVDVSTKTLYWNGLSSFSDFGGVGDAPTPLPVTLSNFNVNCQENETLIYWTTESEHNSAYFILEQSFNGENWRSIYQVAAAGNSQTKLEYNAAFPTLNATYFRLLQVDNDGETKIYGPIFSDCDLTQTTFKTYPNPSGNQFYLSIEGLENETEFNVEIKDITGKLIETKTMEMSEGNNLSLWQLNALPGTYFITIQQDGKTIKTIQHLKL